MAKIQVVCSIKQVRTGKYLSIKSGNDGRAFAINRFLFSSLSRGLEQLRRLSWFPTIGAGVTLDADYTSRLDEYEIELFDLVPLKTLTGSQAFAARCDGKFEST